MSQYSNPQKPAGYESRWQSGEDYLGPTGSLKDNQQTESYEYTQPTEPDHRQFFNSNCPQVQIPRHPMWTAHPYIKK